MGKGPAVSTLRPNARRGTIYILVLMTSVIITLIGIIGFRLTHAQAAVVRADAQRDEAMSLAESAVQWGIHYVSLTDDWRENTTSGTTIRTMNLGGGTISVAIVDLDGDLDDSETDAFTIVGTGTIGGATQSLAVTLTHGTGGPHPALDQSLTVGGTLAANKNVLWLESGGTAQDQELLNGNPYSPKVVDEEDPVDLPDPALIETWASKGVVITRAQHGGTIHGQTLSKTQAPFGASVSPSGIYVIDGGGFGVVMSSSSLTGTIVVRNLGGNTFRLVASSVKFGTHGGPTILVDGDAALAQNFSSGFTDGLIYIDGDATVEDSLLLNGAMMVTEDLRVTASSLYIFDSATAVSGPPEGFVEPPDPTVLPGSWTRLVN